MTETPVSERIRITFLGRTNVGKSSLISLITNQNLSIVSPTPGTTTDPVRKTMELLPLGPVVIVDTAGLDDESELGKLRINKTDEELNKTDIAVIVCAIDQKDFSFEEKIISTLKEKKIPYVVVVNKDDNNLKSLSFEISEEILWTSTLKKTGIEELKNKIASLKPNKNNVTFLEGLVSQNDIIMLVCPIDGSAPKGRLIMPQVMALRDILDKNGVAVTVQPSELEEALKKITPKLVITDSQAFKIVNSIVPKNIPLTSFSILMARYKGDLKGLLEGANVVDSLQDGDKILIAEACTHHAQKNDIGKVQIPKKLLEYTGKNLIFEHISGGSFPENLSEYKLIIHCGGCMISRTMMLYRQNLAWKKRVPITNYGVILAKLTGILNRVVV